MRKERLGVLCRLACVFFALGSVSAEPSQDELAERLGEAVEKGRVEQVRSLLKEGADPDRSIPDEHLDYNALFLSVLGDEPLITEILLEAGADPTIEDGNGDYSNRCANADTAVVVCCCHCSW